MNKYSAVLLLGIYVTLCGSREPFKPKHGSVPYMVYFASQYRGLCSGLLVSRMAVMTAAVCVTDLRAVGQDHRPITVIVGTDYRNPRRGKRVQVTRVLLPRFGNENGQMAFLLEKSPAILLLKTKIPDIMADIPLRALEIDWKGEDTLTLHEECFMTGWHFFYKGDKIYPVHRFHLQQHLRVQFLNIMKMNQWCEPLVLKFQKALNMLGYTGPYDRSASICVKDPGRGAQPCHGMYGSPLVCKGRAVGMLMAPDAQWTNCTGFSNVIHLFNAPFLQGFMQCISRLFDPEFKMNWLEMQKRMRGENDEYDYVPNLYDQLRWSSGSSSKET